MSYILDALRRAEAERERGRGAVPGLHSPNLALAPAAGEAPLTPPSAGSRAPWLVAGVLGLVLLLAVVWWLGRSSAPTPQAAALPPAVADPAPTPVAPLPLSAPTVVVASAPAPAAPRPEPAPPVVALPPAVAPPPAEPARPLPLAQLSPAQQQAFPPLALGGSVWSDSPANRFVIANGQVVREGEAAAPGVTVERIEPRAVIVRWRELRVELPL